MRVSLKPLKELSAILVASSSLLFFGDASRAAPFNLDGSSFERYLNSLNWQEGVNPRFSYLSRCTPSYGSRVNDSHPDVVRWNNYTSVLKREADAGLTADQSSVPGLQPWQIQNRYPVRLIYQEVMREEYNYKKNYQIQSLISYSCSGFVRISDPRGAKVCDTYVQWNSYDNRSTYNYSKCRWQ